MNSGVVRVLCHRLGMTTDREFHVGGAWQGGSSDGVEHRAGQADPLRRILAPWCYSGLVSILALASAILGSCGPRRSQPAVFSCEALQSRAERCEAAILDIVRRQYHAEMVTAGATPEDAEALNKRFRQRFQRRIRERVLERECTEVIRPRDREQTRRASGLRYCFGRPTCEAFGQCLLTL